MTCQEFITAFERLDFEAIPEEQRKELIEHFDGCPVCQLQVEEIEQELDTIIFEEDQANESRTNSRIKDNNNRRLKGNSDRPGIQGPPGRPDTGGA